MAKVMEQSGGVKHALLFVKRGIELNQAPHRSSRNGKDTQRVSESTGFRAVEREECWAELADTPKTLKRCRIHERKHHGFRWLICVQADAAMEWVVICARAHSAQRLHFHVIRDRYLICNGLTGFLINHRLEHQFGVRKPAITFSAGIQWFRSVQDPVRSDAFALNVSTAGVT